MTGAHLSGIQVETLLRAHYAWQQGAFLSHTGEMHGGIAAFSGFTPVPMWNHGAWISGSDDDFRSFIATNAEWQNARNRRPVLYLAEPSAAQRELLEKAGYESFDEEAWMIFAGGDARLSPRVCEVSSEQEQNDLVAVFYSAFNIKQRGYEDALRRHDPRARHYVLYDGAEPVAAGTLTGQGTLGCIYNLGTPPRHRAHGWGRELFEHIIAAARQSGCQTLFLQVESGSPARRLYEKCGFQTAFTRTGFRLKHWQPARAESTRLSNVLGRFGLSENSVQVREARGLREDLSRQLSATPDIFTFAWAYLLHRYLGEEKVSFTRGTDPVEIVVRSESSIADWLRGGTKPAASRDAGETLVCFGPTNRLEGAAFPLEVHITSGNSAPFTLEFVYRADLFSKESVRRMASHYLTILESMAGYPDGRVGEIEILPAQERHQLFVEWNQPQTQFTDKTIHQLFEAQVERTPEAAALSFAKAGVAGAAAQMTYRQLNRRANRLAHQLKSCGVGPDVFVGVCLERSLDMVVSLLAIFKAGGACVPLDPAYPAERLAFILQDTRAPVVLTQKGLAGLFPHATARMIHLDGSGLDGSADSERNLISKVRGENAAYVIYTSGSTGQPKGVVVPHHAIANHSIDCRAVYGLSARDHVLQFSSFNFDASLEQILPALISGANLVIRDAEVWSTREFANKLAEFQLTVADIPTAYWHQLASEWFTAGAVPPNNLRLVIVGGEALSPDKLALWQQTAMNKVRLINAYGPTEATITATSFEVPPRKNGEPPSPRLPIGRPRGDRRAYVLDPLGRPVPIGIPGELHIGGTLLARGYHNRPELTAERFIANPFSDEADARLYKTGDLVRYLEDGNLEFLGRIDDQVKIRGFRIELGELESCLRAHPAVSEAVVLARENSDGDRRLVAYAASNGGVLDERELRAHLRGRLPEYMLPSALVILERFPLLPSGKIDRRALPEPAEQASGTEFLGPRDPLELQVQLLFERVLRRVPIGINVNFFELGGDSLQALELLVEIERATGKQLPLGTLYQSSTVETLARELRQRSENEEWSSLVPLQSGGPSAPFFLLHTTPGDILGYGNLVFRLGPDQPCFGFQSLGLKDPQLSHHTIEQMAEYYVTLLRGHQPRGPYYLGGWCYGGIVAVEMARLLKAQGQEVALLALLETVAMPPAFPNWAYYRHRLRCFLRMSPYRWLAYARAKIKYVHESRIANRMRFRQVDPTGAAAETRDPRLVLLEHVYNANLQALDRYRSRYYDGKVVLFNAADKDPALIPDPRYGWVGLASEIEIHEVPGNHDTMLTEPNVSVLARELSDGLRRARARYPGGEQ